MGRLNINLCTPSGFYSFNNFRKKLGETTQKVCKKIDKFTNTKDKLIFQFLLRKKLKLKTKLCMVSLTQDLETRIQGSSER